MGGGGGRNPAACAGQGQHANESCQMLHRGAPQLTSLAQIPGMDNRSRMVQG